MIAYSDTARMYIAAETTWGKNPGGTYQGRPFQRDSLAPELRHNRPNNLHHNGVSLPPLLTEETIIGDIELLATSHNLNFLLPQLLHTKPAPARKELPNVRTSTDGDISINGIFSDLIVGDYVFTSNSGTETGWHRAVKYSNSNSIKLAGFSRSKRLPSTSSFEFNPYRPGSTPQSMSIYKSYQDGQEWLRFNGSMINRLTLDLAEGELFSATASIIGKNMDIAASRPGIALQKEHPLGFSTGLKTFSLSDGDSENFITQDNSVVTGFRLVMERTGMVPQYAIGSTKPKLILPGELSVYGTIDMLIGDYQLFNWMQQERSLEMAIALEDEAKGGAAFVLPDIRLTGVDVSPVANGQPIRARFQFDAFAQGASPLVSCFVHQM